MHTTIPSKLGSGATEDVNVRIQQYKIDTTIRLTTAWGAYCLVRPLAADDAPTVLKRPNALKPRAVPPLIEFDRTTKVEAVWKRVRASKTRVFIAPQYDLVRCNVQNVFIKADLLIASDDISSDLSYSEPMSRSCAPCDELTCDIVLTPIEFDRDFHHRQCNNTK
jgi:hypothetical protein